MVISTVIITPMTRTSNMTSRPVDAVDHEYEHQDQSDDDASDDADDDRVRKSAGRHAAFVGDRTPQGGRVCGRRQISLSRASP